VTPLRPQVETVTGYSGTANEYAIRAGQERRSVTCRDASNAHAERAMHFGLLGFEITAQAYAQNADLCAMLAEAYETIEAIQRLV
jgi:hypothetical protein